MKVLVTGGTGFVGARLVAELAARGDDVTVVTRAPARAAAEGVSFIGWEPFPDPAAYEAVVHLAGEPILAKRWTPAQRERLRSSRVDTTRELWRAMKHSSQRPSAFVCASAVGIYGDRGDEELTEQSAPGPDTDFLANLCRVWEGEARRADKLGVRTTRLRLGVVLGSGGGALREMLPPFRLGLGGPIGSGRQFMSWIHVDDAAGMIRWALDTDAVQGAYNAVAPGVATNREFSRALGRVLHRPARLPIPPAALRLRWGQGVSVLTASQRALPARALEQGFRFEHPEIEGALRAILS